MKLRPKGIFGVCARILFGFLFLFSFSLVPAYAANPAAPFTPADNILDPNCSPTDSNCYVSVDNLTLTNATSTNFFSTLLNAITAIFTTLSTTGTTTLATTGGNVGIGSTTPSSKLTVNGGAYFGGNVVATGTLNITGQTTLTTASSTALTVSGDSYLGGNLIVGNAVNGSTLRYYPSTNTIVNGAFENSIGEGSTNSIIAGGGATGSSNINSIATSSYVSTISGGYDNTIGGQAPAATISGGAHHRIDYGGTHGAIGGGSTNIIQAGGDYGFIGAGLNNVVNGTYAFIGAGSDNTSTGFRSAVLGGYSNDATGDYAVSLGGWGTVAAGNYSLAWGYRANAQGQGTMVLADSQNAALSETGTNVFLARFAGGYKLTGGNVGIGTTSPISLLSVQASSTAPTSPFVSFNSTTSPIFNILANGNVGIGTISPTYRLSVVGTSSLGDQAIAGYFTATTTATSTFAGPLSVGGITVYASSTLSQWITNADINKIDSNPNSLTAFILGGGRTNFPNLIGLPTLPNGSDWIPTDWSADTGYISGSTDVALIVGGYDNIVNQEAGTIVGGGHNFIKYNVQGHSIIGGGSYNVISAGRAGIFSGRRNTVTGTSSIFSFIGGGDNNNITGSYSVISGGAENTVTGDYSFASGYRAKVTGSGSTLLKDATNADFTVTQANSLGLSFAGGVGIGTGAPAETFHIKTNETGVGTSLLRLDNGGTFSNEVGMEFWSSTSNDVTSLRIGRIYGKFDGANSTDARLTFQTRTTGGALVDILSLKNGNVGIGTTTPQYLLSVGNATVSGIVARFQNSTGYCDINPTTTSLSCTSDERLKKNIVSLDTMATLEKLTQLNPVTYNWVSEDSTSSSHAGFIAQQVKPLFPDLVSTDAQGTMSVSYSGFIPYIVESIKSIVVSITNLKDSLASLVRTHQLETETLCVGTLTDKTCITKDQLDALLRSANQSSALQPVEPSSGASSPDLVLDPAATSTPDTSSDSTDTASTSTAPVIPADTAASDTEAASTDTATSTYEN